MPSTLLASTPIVIGTKITSKAMRLKQGGGVSFQLWTDGTVDASAAWVIRGSNLPGADVGGDPNASDITAAFKRPDGTAVAAVAHGTAATQSQGVQAGPIYFAYVWAELTPTAGAGNAGVNANEAEKV